MTYPIASPWIHQLNEHRKNDRLAGDDATDVVIVGGGIAGVCTAFFALRHTDKKIILLEAFKIAHGATGHNAGQIVSYFEHPFARLVQTYGMTLAARAQESIYYAWDLLEEIYAAAALTTPKHVFTGYAGCSSVAQILHHLKNIFYQRQAGLSIEELLVLNSSEIIQTIPSEYTGLYAAVDVMHIARVLETNDPRYIGALASKKGCLNSALFCEELTQWMLEHYPERFKLYEHSPVTNIILSPRSATVAVGQYMVKCKRIVLCTNGFENFKITNAGMDIDTKFHQQIISKIGYMAAYAEPTDQPPAAISYFTTPGTSEADPYFYMTRRPYKHKQHGDIKLISIGGPEDNLEHKGLYNKDKQYPAQANAALDSFVRRTYGKAAPTDFLFRWHGLMGYTPSGLRCIGPEPCNPVLLYNLGCNGVGILSSIYGGRRIASFLNKQRLEISVFDPSDKHCVTRPQAVQKNA